MTREEILIKSIWTEAKMNVYSAFFEKEIRFDLFSSDYNLENTKNIISERFVEAVNDFLKLSEDAKPLITKLLHAHCIECCRNTSYGFEVLDGETEFQANLREFGIKNAESAFLKANIDHVSIDENELVNNRFVRIVFFPDWEEEHGGEVILKNGVLLDFYGSSGSYIGTFDS